MIAVQRPRFSFTHSLQIFNSHERVFPTLRSWLETNTLKSKLQRCKGHPRRDHPRWEGHSRHRPGTTMPALRWAVASVAENKRRDLSHMPGLGAASKTGKLPLGPWRKIHENLLGHLIWHWKTVHHPQLMRKDNDSKNLCEMATWPHYLFGLHFSRHLPMHFGTWHISLSPDLSTYIVGDSCQLSSWNHILPANINGWVHHQSLRYDFVCSQTTTSIGQRGRLNHRQSQQLAIWTFLQHTK